jgi:predicted CoA-substrate-specific enzyme activase
MDMQQGVKNPIDIEKLREFILRRQSVEKGYIPLPKNSRYVASLNERLYMDVHEDEIRSGKKVKAYLGIDVGSISTNLAVIDEQGRLLAKRYLMTAGRPIEAVKQGLDEIGNEIGDKVEIHGVGTTGSGRYMIADFVGADIVKNEITAQAQAAVEIDPEVDTIFEIGGQDSKYISLKDGVIVDFEMNKACAAGTGSFLEEQSEKLGISIKGEFAELAFQSQSPSALGERCTVFMENSLLARLQRGISKENLVAGLSYSIVQNYINRVVGDKHIGKKIFFQGGVAFNKAVVAAFEGYLGKEIIVPPHHDVTGAIGMAYIAMRHMKSRGSGVREQGVVNSYQLSTFNFQPLTKFKGFDLSKRNYKQSSFECKGCDNLCEINKVQVEGEKDALFYGSRCEKYDVKRKKIYTEANSFPDLFAERHSLLTEALRYYQQRNSSTDMPCIGIPRIFFFHEFLPYWSTLIGEMGFRIEVSPETNQHVIRMGIETIFTESCFPHKVAHGHIKSIIDKNVDALLIPSFINFNEKSDTVRSFACPYTQTIPYFSNLIFGNNGVHIIKPILNFELGKEKLLEEITKEFRRFGVSKSTVKKAMQKADEAQRLFIISIKRRGQEILDSLSEKTIVIVGRPYNAFDSGINMKIPEKLSTLGMFTIPMDFLPIENVDIKKIWPNMYWRSGQNILRAVEIIRENPNLFALFIGNFSCGPDSFIHRFFKEAMGEKPFLQIEIDEHSADAGIITRCEAFLDSIDSDHRKFVSAHWKTYKGYNRNVYYEASRQISSQLKKRTIFIPKMSDHAFSVAAAFQSCGINAQVMDPPDLETVKTGRRFVSGKECYPCLITTGDMVKKALSPDFDPDKSAFFMPSGSGPCRFGQYNILHRIVLNRIGFSSVPIFSPNQDSSLYEELGIVGDDFTRQAWKGIIATELLIKCLHEIRPYEIKRGQTEEIYGKYLHDISSLVREKSDKFEALLEEICNEFKKIPRIDQKKPLIGIVGEIFVRHNIFSNENIIKKVESMGGEVWLAPFEEWIYYINTTALRHARERLRNGGFSIQAFKEILSLITTRYVQKKVEHKFSRHFKGFLKTLHEPSTKEIFRNASPYLHDSFEGEAVLSIGKAVDYVKRGASGVINVMPFGCMPGTIVSAFMKGLKQDTGIPYLNIAFDGTEATCSEIQLEAFMYQAYEYLDSRFKIQNI